MIKSLWGSASNAVALAADRLESMGAAIKDTLAEDMTDGPDYEREAEEYKKMLNELELQQGRLDVKCELQTFIALLLHEDVYFIFEVELSKQSRLALAHKEAEIEVYKMKLKEFLPDDASLEQVKLSSAVSLDNAMMRVSVWSVATDGHVDIHSRYELTKTGLNSQAEKEALEETVSALQTQLQGLLDVVNDARMKENQLR